MRAFKTLLFVLGAGLLGVLVYRVGPEPILQALNRLTWWQCILVCLPYALSAALDTLGWRFAFARDGAPFWRLYGARLAGESLNLVAAVGPVPGEAAKAWLVRRDVSYAESVPSVVIAKTTITIAQALFLLIGLLLAWHTLPLGSDLLRAMLWLLTAEVVGVAGFVWAQMSGLVGRAGRLLRVVGVQDSTEYAESLNRALRHYYSRQWRRLGLSIGFHLLGWLVTPLETVIVLWALGIDASVVTAIVIETLGSGVRFATFLIPASLGALEAANAAAFAALGFGAGAGLAFTFIRRARQAVWIAIGIVVLMAMRWTSRRPSRATSRSIVHSRKTGEPVDKFGGGCYPERCSHLARRSTGGIAMAVSVGFIGVGNMGNPMAGNVLKSGFPMTVYDKNPKAMENLLQGGAKSVASPREVVERSEVVMTCLPASPDVEALYLDAGGAGGSRPPRHDPDRPEQRAALDAAARSSRGPRRAACTSWRPR